MSTKRQPSKQRRQTQNHRQRAALEARRANAAAAPVTAGPSSDGPSTGSAAPGGRASMLSRLRGASATGRAARTGVAPGSSTGTLPVGHRAALSALLAAAAAAIVGALLISVPVDRQGDPIGSPGAMVGEWALSAWDVVQEDPSATADEVVEGVDDWLAGGEERYGQAYFPQSLLLALPVIGAGLVFRAVSRRAPGKAVNRAMYVTLFGTLLNGAAVLLFLPAAVGAAIAAFQVRKYEIAVAAASGEAEGPDGPGRDGVIDVDEVDLDDEADGGDDELEVDEAIDDESAIETDELLEADDADEPGEDDGRDR